MDSEIEDMLITVGRLKNYYYKRVLKYRRKKNLSRVMSLGMSLSTAMTSSPFILVTNMLSYKTYCEKKDKYERKYIQYLTYYIEYDKLYNDIFFLTMTKLTTDEILENIHNRIKLIQNNDITISFDDAIIIQSD